jgi:polysaccharide biosynthesis/export protein
MIYRILIFCSLLSATSCIPYKDLILFRKDEKALPDIPSINSYKNLDLPIQPNDALSITVSCLDPQLAVPFNLVDMRSGGNIQSNSPLLSFLVDSNGEIDYPVLGKIQVAKLTIPQLRDVLTKKLQSYIKEPSLNIRRVNFKVTVLGEVVKPGSFEVVSERITILEALGLAGDMTPHSDRQRIMVVREENGKITTRKIDLQSPDFFNSPFYYLHQNDVVYVDPKKTKKGNVNDPANKYLNWITAGFSSIAALLSIVAILKK